MSAEISRKGTRARRQGGSWGWWRVVRCAVPGWEAVRVGRGGFGLALVLGTLVAFGCGWSYGLVWLAGCWGWQMLLFDGYDA